MEVEGKGESHALKISGLVRELNKAIHEAGRDGVTVEIKVEELQGFEFWNRPVVGARLYQEITAPERARPEDRLGL